MEQTASLQPTLHTLHTRYSIFSSIQYHPHSCSLSSDSSQQSPPQTVPDEADRETSPSLADALGKAGLADLVPTLEKEQIDFESLVSLC